MKVLEINSDTSSSPRTWGDLKPGTVVSYEPGSSEVYIVCASQMDDDNDKVYTFCLRSNKKIFTARTDEEVNPNYAIHGPILSVNVKD